VAVSASAPASVLYVGPVRHRRHRPVRHELSHRTFHALIDVDDLARLDREVPGFGVDRWAPMGFRTRDHLDRGSGPLRARLAALVAARGGRLPAGPLQLLGRPRTFGHVFNPVAWWFAHHPDGTLGMVVAEVTSTFGDRSLYLLDAPEPGRDGLWRATATKALHVSPFLPVDGLGYRFAFLPPGLPPGPRVLVRMEVADADGPILDAVQDGRRRALDGPGVARTLLRHPVASVAALGSIHGHALRLWRKGVPFHRRPAPPAAAVRVGGRRAGMPSSPVDGRHDGRSDG
jgi:DUF1365 family protein